MIPRNTTSPDRRRYRLPNHDYRRPAAYFVTICTHKRQRTFGKIHDGIMHLNDAGRIADEHWKSLPDHFPHVRLYAHIVMPDHIHGIIDIVDGGYSVERRPLPQDQIPAGPQHAAAVNDAICGDAKRPQHAAALRVIAGSLGAIVRSYKSAVTAGINRIRGKSGAPVWQYRYHERIIRTDASRERIRRYIENNPARWTIDHPDR